MTSLSKIVILGLVVATGISAAVAASSLSSAAEPVARNFTVIHKTDGLWPLKGMVSVEPCSIRKCVEA